MDLGGLSWSLVTIIGVILLGSVVAWAALRERSGKTGRTEQATRELYRKEDQEHRGESDSVP